MLCRLLRPAASSRGRFSLRAMASSGTDVCRPRDKIVCLGKNYLEHQKEMGDAIIPKPIFFLKPPSAAACGQCAGDPVRVTVPRGRGSCHYETEVVFRVGPDGAGFDAVTLGLDLTLRDEQNAAKKAGHPWEAAKVFPGSAVVGPWVPLTAFPGWAHVAFTFSLDGQMVQSGIGSDMMLAPEPALAAARDLFGIVPGDWLFTGTPAGVGPVRPGQSGSLAWGDKVAFQVEFV